MMRAFRRSEDLERRFVSSGVPLGSLAVAALLAIAGGNPGLAAAMVAAVILFVLALNDLSMGTAVLVATVPIQSEFAVQAAGREITATKLAVAAIGAAWLVRCLGDVSNPPIDAIAIGFAAYVLVLLLSAIEARDLNAWGEEVYRWAVALFAYVLARESLSTPDARRRFLFVLSGAAIVMCGVAAWQVVKHAGPPTFTVNGVTRAFGSFGEPNPFAAYFEFSVPVLIALSVQHFRFSLDRLVILLGAISGVLGLALTQSRGGYLGFAASIAVVLCLSGGTVRKVGTVAGLIGIAAIILSPFGGRLRDGLQIPMLNGAPVQVTTDNFAAQERAAHWGAAVRMAESSPYLGIGAGNFNERYREMTPAWRFRIPRGHAHSNYLQALGQAGLFGLIAYLGLLLAVSTMVLRKLRFFADRDSRAMTIGVAGVTSALLVHGLFDYLHVLSLGILLSTVWGCLAALPERTPVSVPLS
jgi:O-antigen ligase